MVATTLIADRVTVPKLWPGSTIVCAASGPSLTQEDLDFVRDKAPVIVVNDAVRLAPWAAVLYSSDQYWYPNHQGAPEFQGVKYAMAPRRGQSWHGFGQWPEIQVLANAGEDGLELSPDGLRTGRNSGYAAVNLAVHLGAERIVLLGYDMGLGPGGVAHFHGDRQGHPVYASFVRYFESLVEPLRALGVTVVNASRASALNCFPRVPLAEAFA